MFPPFQIHGIQKKDSAKVDQLGLLQKWCSFILVLLRFHLFLSSFIQVVQRCPPKGETSDQVCHPRTTHLLPSRNRQQAPRMRPHLSLKNLQLLHRSSRSRSPPAFLLKRNRVFDCLSTVLTNPQSSGDVFWGPGMQPSRMTQMEVLQHLTNFFQLASFLFLWQ